MKAAVIVFPGSNCDRDVAVALEGCGAAVTRVWHQESALPKSDLVVLPGGFSYGDYLRAGAMAAQSPIMQEVKRHAEAGGYILGICNGFQMLTEMHLLPGTLMRNRDLDFICRDVCLKVEQADSPFTRAYTPGQVVTIPIAHHDGNYFAHADEIKALEDGGQVAFRYVDAGGEANDNSNPNGSVANIAGVLSAKKTILGLMPHPERMWEAPLGGTDGRGMFDGLIEGLG